MNQQKSNYVLKMLLDSYELPSDTYLSLVASLNTLHYKIDDYYSLFRNTSFSEVLRVGSSWKNDSSLVLISKFIKMTPFEKASYLFDYSNFTLNENNYIELSCEWQTLFVSIQENGLDIIVKQKDKEDLHRFCDWEHDFLQITDKIILKLLIQEDYLNDYVLTRLSNSIYLGRGKWYNPYAK